MRFSLFQQLIKRSFAVSFQYRSEIALWFALDFIPTFVLIVVWSSILKSGSSVAGYDLSSMIQYYFLTAIITSISATHFEGWRTTQIREGKIDYFLIRPLSYLAEIATHDLGGKIFYISLNLIAFSALFAILSQWFTFGALTITWWSIAQFSLLMVCGYCMQLMIALIIVILGFWFEGSEGLEHFKFIGIALLSGSMIPIALLPSWLQAVVSRLPLQYLYATPIGVLQNRTQLSFTDLGFLAATLLSLMMVITFLWQKSQYKYASAGG